MSRPVGPNELHQSVRVLLHFTQVRRHPYGGASSAVRAQCNYLGVWPY